jgi:hypothetical protein
MNAGVPKCLHSNIMNVFGLVEKKKGVNNSVRLLFMAIVVQVDHYLTHDWEHCRPDQV